MTTRTLNETDRDLDAATELVERLFRTQHRHILAYVYVLLQEKEDAFDITQDTFVDLLIDRHKLLTVGNPRDWTYRIARRRATNWVKRIRRFRWLPWRPLSNEPELIWEGQELSLNRSLHMERVMRRLPRKDLGLLILYYHVGLGAREIGQVLKLSESGVRMRVQRARLAFAFHYREENRDA